MVWNKNGKLLDEKRQGEAITFVVAFADFYANISKPARIAYRLYLWIFIDINLSFSYSFVGVDFLSSRNPNAVFHNIWMLS